jgi:maltose O-acetyltransferase
MDELAKLRRGENFDGWDPEIVAQRDLVTKVLQQAATAPAADRPALFRSILGDLGQGSVIQPPFVCEFGITITVGRRCFINSGATMLDGGTISIGDHVLIGPNTSLFTVGHPLDYLRRREWETEVAPVVIEDDVWIGGHVVVQPGVRIGARSVIGSGSVVTRDVPPDSVAVGAPARVTRSLAPPV